MPYDDSGGGSECLIFEDEGHAIVKRENRAVLVKTIREWLDEAFKSPK